MTGFQSGAEGADDGRGSSHVDEIPVHVPGEADGGVVEGEVLDLGIARPEDYGLLVQLSVGAVDDNAQGIWISKYIQVRHRLSLIHI